MQLHIENGSRAGTIVPLDRNQAVTIGSDPSCQVRLAEAGVAAQHAVVKALKGEGFGIKALAPGLRIGGRETEAAPLAEGDMIEVGTVRMRYASAAGRQATSGAPTIRGFRVLGELGRGGMGMVYRAEQVSLHREVALKVLSRELTKDPAFVAKFVAEARSAAKLQHPNVVQVFDVEQDGETYYYAMELMHHGSLESWLRKHGRMPAERALQVVADAAAGLAYAESLRITHRDIKPDNLMLDQHEVVKIADLGLARSDGETEEKVAGTPHFMAPEQVLRKPLDHRTDLYALGCTFYRLVTGRTVFQGATTKDILRAQVKDAPEPPHKVQPDVPVAVSTIVLKLLQKEPADRYQSANELLADIQDLLAPKARKGLWIGLSAAAVVVAGTAIWYAATREPETVVVDKYRDNPEAARLAKENEELKAGARELQARVALLEARASGRKGDELAADLDAVAKLHEGTAAAREAAEVAAVTRATEAARRDAAQRKESAVAEAMQALTPKVNAAVEAGEWAKALELLAAPAPEAVRGLDEYEAALRVLGDRVAAAARARVDAATKPVLEARQARDAAALAAALPALESLLADNGPLPSALLGDREELQRLAQSSAGALAELRDEKLTRAWTEFAKGAARTDGLKGHLVKAALADAARAARSIAETLGDEAAATHARNLAEAMQQASTFATALASQARSSKLALQRGAENLSVHAVDWAAGTWTWVDAARKGAKEQSAKLEELDGAQWTTLAEQVNESVPGQREAFLTFVLLGRHLPAATGYLGGFDKAAPDGGTGAKGYPLGTEGLAELTSRELPPAEEPWRNAARAELAATATLVKGLRALSEQRNLAASKHFERLLSDHPHSLAVIALP